MSSLYRDNYRLEPFRHWIAIIMDVFAHSLVRYRAWQPTVTRGDADLLLSPQPIAPAVGVCGGATSLSVTPIAAGENGSAGYEMWTRFGR
jgi:hypothetical protein